MPEFSANLWAPWRMEYIRSLGPELTEQGCFLCRYWGDPAGDRANHVLWRRSSCFVVMNRFPYTNGHLLVASSEHKAELADFSEARLGEMTAAIRDAVAVLRATIKPNGFNIGYNLGHCAGAGLPTHLHAHVVPRWTGDTNFMAVVGDVRVVPDSLNALAEQLIKNAHAVGVI